MNELTIEVAAEILVPEGEYAVGMAKVKTEVGQAINNAIVITSISTLTDQQQAVAAGRYVQAMNKRVKEFYKPFKQRIDEVKGAVLAEENSSLDALNVEKERLGLLIQQWEAKEDRRLEEQERRDREEAKKVEEDRRLEDAIALEQEGFTEQATALLEQEAMPIPVIAQRTVPQRTKGKVTRKTYRGKVVDFKALVCACAAGKVPLDVLQVNQPFLNSQATDYREGLNWPGVSVEIEVGTHFRI